VFSVEQAVSLVGDDPMNEDVAGWTAGAAWVIDGATPLGEPYTAGPLTSAAWFAQRLSAQFALLLRGVLESEYAKTDWGLYRAGGQGLDGPVSQQPADRAAPPVRRGGGRPGRARRVRRGHPQGHGRLRGDLRAEPAADRQQ
jgi:hypothetical protein